MDSREFFDRGEIREKLGVLVCTKIEFLGLPSGTLGVVHRFALSDKILAVEWLMGRRLSRCVNQPLVDWFSPREYYRFLVEVGKVR